VAFDVSLKSFWFNGMLAVIQLRDILIAIELILLFKSCKSLLVSEKRFDGSL
jgi:hypothetical protein